jgi:hypothetical protein
VTVLPGGIETAPNADHVDFANRFLGGGVICGGCVQEEIAFARAPELCVGMWACEAMAGGSVSGSGWVAVGPIDSGARCGHFEW